MKLKLRHRMQALILVVCMVASMCFTVSVYAKEQSLTVDELEEIEKDLDETVEGSGSASKKLEEVEMKAEIMNGELQRIQDELALAKENEDNQYENMKTRIKYMYESGNTSLIEMLLSAENMVDFLNKADFVQNVSDYDREMLKELNEVRRNIEEKEKIALGMTDAMDELVETLTTQKEEEEKAVVVASDGATVKGNSMAATADDHVLLAAIIECEAYQDYNSLLAVATVIMNRVEDPRFPNTIEEVVYASNQFEPVTLGSLEACLNRGPSDLSLQVASDALGGTRLEAVADCYYFLYAGATNRPGVNVGNNLFFVSW